ncbi:hypothetical protein AAHE18_20G225200 [Arachis hypogaea]
MTIKNNKLKKIMFYIIRRPTCRKMATVAADERCWRQGDVKQSERERERGLERWLQRKELRQKQYANKCVFRSGLRECAFDMLKKDFFFFFLFLKQKQRIISM